MKKLNLNSILRLSDSKTILNGREYFELNKVSDLNFIKDGDILKISTICNGYNNKLIFKDEKLIDYDCNCWLKKTKMFCKHLVASTYFLNLKICQENENIYGIDIKKYQDCLNYQIACEIINLIKNNSLMFKFEVSNLDYKDSFDFQNICKFKINDFKNTLDFLLSVKNDNPSNNDLNFLIKRIEKIIIFINEYENNAHNYSYLLDILLENFLWLKNIFLLKINNFNVNEIDEYCDRLNINFDIKVNLSRLFLQFIDIKLIYINNNYLNSKVKIILLINNEYYYINCELDEFNISLLSNLVKNIYKNNPFDLKFFLQLYKSLNESKYFNINFDQMMDKIFTKINILFDFVDNEFCIIIDFKNQNSINIYLYFLNYLFSKLDININLINNINFFKNENNVKIIIKHYFWYKQLYDCLRTIKQEYSLKNVDLNINQKTIIDVNKNNNNSSVEIKFTNNKFDIVFKKDDQILEKEFITKLNQKIKSNDSVFLKYNNEIYNVDDFKNINEFLTTFSFINNNVANVCENIKYLFFASSLLPKENVIEFINWFEKYKPIINMDKNVENYLKPYQIDGVNWINKMMKLTNGCILADEMGLGKTIQTIAYINSYQKENEKPILIIAPNTVINVWKEEFKKILNYNINEIDGLQDKRHELISLISKNNIYICSYHKLLNDINFYANKEFSLIVLDEGHYIKNKDSKWSKNIKKLNADQRLILSGTPIENNLGEIWSLFDFIQPDYLPSYSQFNKLFKNNIELLSLIIKPFILQRRKADELKDIPNKFYKKIYIDLSLEEKKIYEELSKNIQDKIKIFLNNQNSKDRYNILALITKLRMFLCDPKLLNYDNIDSSKIKKCFEIISNILSASKNSKIVIFSNFSSLLDELFIKLKNENYSCYILTGKNNKNERIKIIDNFNKSNNSILLISLKAGGVGINLSSANYVIHFNPWWNDSAENQATDRLHRIGQKNDVHIYNLICKNTIEEYIEKIKDNKNRLISKTLNNKQYMELFNLILNGNNS